MPTPPVATSRDLQTLSINTVRMLAADAVQQARSGHPGMPMGAAAMAYALWTRHLRFDSADPSWPDRDRFVLSAGHGSMLLYALLHLNGFDLSLDDIRAFRQWGSRTPGHPEFGETPGVETTTGPLGQGFGNAVGMALAEARLAAEFNRPGHDIIDHTTYVIASDGDLMEGVHAEAASLAGHLRLGRLVVLYDDNDITIDGSTSLAFSEDVPARFAAYGWHTSTVTDGNDVDAVDAALAAAREDPRPSLIAVKTRIGFGSPNKEHTASAHGEPLGEDELAATKDNLGWPQEPRFHVPHEVREHFRQVAEQRAAEADAWRGRLERYRNAFPEEAAELERRWAGRLPEGWDAELPSFEADAAPLATRAASGKVLNALAGRIPEMTGGSADLSPSNKTVIESSADLTADDYAARNIRFGVREHGMGAILNGMALHGGFRPYGGTFLIFHDYMRPSVRLAALMKLPVIYVYTHDSIAVGEDGPTHQPIEHLAALRAMPGLVVLRPADANETREAWRVAMGEPGPVALVLTRQKLPVLELDTDQVERGGYIASDSEGEPELILLATGSELQLAEGAARRLRVDGIAVRVVSLPSWELFERQSDDYRESVLPETCTRRLAVEAACELGWARYTGARGETLSIDRFGASAPGPENLERFGFTVAEVEKRARRLLSVS